MLKNYITIALRNLRKHRFYSFINVAGLSVGVSICLVILLFVMVVLFYVTILGSVPQQHVVFDSNNVS